MELLAELHRIIRNANVLTSDLCRILDERIPMDSLLSSHSQRAAAIELWRLRYPQRCKLIGKRLIALVQRHDKTLLEWAVHQKTILKNQSHIINGCLDDLQYEVSGSLRPSKLLSYTGRVEYSIRKSGTHVNSQHDLNSARAQCVRQIEKEFRLILSEHAESDIRKLQDWIARHPHSIVSSTHKTMPADVNRICRGLTRTLNRGAAYELASLHLGVSIKTIQAACTKSHHNTDRNETHGTTLVLPRTESH